MLLSMWTPYNSDLLAKLPATGETSQRSLGRLHLAHPILSLSDKRIVFLMGKLRTRDKKALVLAVDMEKSRLQRAAVFDAERMVGTALVILVFNPRSPVISTCHQGQGEAQTAGKFNMLYPCKYQSGVTMDDNEMASRSRIPVGVQEHEDCEAKDGDNYMLLD